MQPFYLFISVFGVVLANNEKLAMVSTTRTTVLEKYRSYSDAVVMHFRIPDDVTFASFKFEGSDIDMSIFGR